MNMLQIAYFLALAENRSFKKTAEALYVSQPAVSIQITSLEKEWGMKLFNRMYKEVSLTPSGEVMYDMLSTANTDFEFAFAKAKKLYQDTRTILYIGMPEYFDLQGVEDVITHFQQTHSLVSVNLEICPPSELSLSKGKIDKFDIVINQSHMLRNTNGLRTKLIRTNYFTLNVQENKEYRLMTKEEVFSSLTGKTLYAPRPTKIITEEYIRNLCADMGFYPGEIITYSNIHSVMVAAKMGFGVALLDDGMFIPKELHLQSFKTDSKIEWALAWRDDSMKKSLKELVSLILELCEEES